MNKPLKYTLIGLGSLLALLIAVIVIVPLFVDVNDFKDEIAGVVKEQTGRDLVFEGDISVKIFPWVGLELGPVRLADDPAFGSADFARIKGAAFKAELMPMFSGAFVIENVRVDGLVLNLVKDERGYGNWEALMGKQAPGAAGMEKSEAGAEDDAFKLEGPQQAATDSVKERDLSESAPPPPPSMQAASVPKISIGSVSVVDANISYADRATGASYTVKDFGLTTGTLNADDPALFTDLSIRAALSLSEPQLDATLTATAKANMVPDTQILTVKDLDATVAATGAAVPGGKAEVRLAGTAVYDMLHASAALEKTTLSAYGASLALGLGAAHLDAEPEISGTLSLERTDLRAVMAALGAPLPVMKDPRALGAVAAQVTLLATPARANISRLALDVDGQTLSGTLTAREFDKPDVTFRLASPSLDVDRYMPTEKAGEEASASGEKTGSAKDSDTSDGTIFDEATKKALRTLALDGKIEVARLKASGVTASDVTVTVAAKDGKITVDPLSLGLYGGTVKTALGLDVTGKAARTDIKLDLASVGLGGLLKDALGKEVLSGVAKMGLNLTGTGDDWKSLARTLAGKADFALRNGAIHGFRLVPDEAQKQMKSQTQRTALEKAQKQQNFKAITASFRVKDGIVSNNDLAFMAEGLSAKGKGGLDLAAGTMDMLAYVDVTALPTIPVRAQGPLDDLSYGMDMAEFVKGTVTSIVKKPLEAGGALLQGVGSALGIAPKEKEDPKDTQKSNGGLLDAIGGMFGGSKQ